MLALGAGSPSPLSSQVPLAFANKDTEARRGVVSPHDSMAGQHPGTG